MKTQYDQNTGREMITMHPIEAKAIYLALLNPDPQAHRVFRSSMMMRLEIELGEWATNRLTAHTESLSH